MNEKRINNLIAFLLLFYVFNLTIISGGIPQAFIIIFNYMFPILGFVLIVVKKILKKEKIIKLDLIIFFITLIFEFFLIFRNGNISHRSNLSLVFNNVLFLFVPFFTYRDKNLLESIIKMMPIFFAEHIIGVFLEFLFPNLYFQLFINGWMNNALPRIKSFMITIYNNGFMSGFTTHYSSTGIYLSISILYYYCRILINKEKRKSSIILFILSIVSLLMTGKRATIIFSLISCFVMFVIIEKNRTKILRFLFSTIAILSVLTLCSFFIPTIKNTYLRFTQGDISTTFGNRKPLYDYAKLYYKQNKLFGNGWSTFKYSFYNNNGFYDTSGTLYDCHNIYLQLLCETGIIGCLFIVGFMIFILYKTIKLVIRLKEKKENTIFVFSAIFQLYFLLYGFTGNPLYDIHCYFIYYICVAILLNVLLINYKNTQEVN